MAVPEPIQNPPEDTSVIREMRAKLDAANQEAKAREQEAASLKAQLDEIEKQKMTDNERLRAEKAEAEGKLSELETYRDEHGKLASKLESLYNAQLEAVPDAQRSQVESLSKQGSWADRLESLSAAVQLIAPVPVIVPRIQPGHPGPVTETPPAPEQKTNADVAKANGVFGLDISKVEYSKKPNNPSA